METKNDSAASGGWDQRRVFTDEELNDNNNLWLFLKQELIAFVIAEPWAALSPRVVQTACGVAMIGGQAVDRAAALRVGLVTRLIAAAPENALLVETIAAHARKNPAFHAMLDELKLLPPIQLALSKLWGTGDVSHCEPTKTTEVEHAADTSSAS